MNTSHLTRLRSRTARYMRLIAGTILATASLSLPAAQINIAGPAGSGTFGSWVTALPNGNFVVTDPTALSGLGAVYLYSSSGSLISTLTGSSANDHVGKGGVVVLSSGNFVAISSDWNNGAATGAGAVTWINRATGLNGIVSLANSLVGTTTGDAIGYDVTALASGNYLVTSPDWNNGNAGAGYGAVTWGSGAGGISGPVSSINSLIGTTSGDNVGSDGVTVLSNGNYVVASPNWNNGVAGSGFGAATWGSGATGIVGVVSPSNSLIGTTAGENIGSFGIYALGNGNYVVNSPYWSNGSLDAAYGAATWGNGAVGISGAVTTSNSLVGTTPGDQVGLGFAALSNGNYVVSSSNWNNGVANSHVGAVTWGNGAIGIRGAVTSGNSLIGTTPGDLVGDDGVAALSNGNYVVASPYWNNGIAGSSVGAATWGNGATGIVGAVSASNSLIGTTQYDQVGAFVTPLSNGHYVVGSYAWHGVGAATWGNGAVGTVGTVAVSNSLVGTTTDDRTGIRITPLSNGNYVVLSSLWHNGVANGNYGALTWGNGISGTSGPVSTSNSLYGTTVNDDVGAYDGAIALVNGNYVASSALWNNGVTSGLFGAATWGSGTNGVNGPVSGSNSLIGTTMGDSVAAGYFGGGGIQALSDGNYLVLSPYWDNGPKSDAGAITLANGRFRLKGPIQSWNSVLGKTAGGGSSMAHDYDAVRHRLVVGRPAENIVSLFTMDQIFAGDFEP